MLSKKRTGFASQHQHSGSQPSLTAVQRDPMSPLTSGTRYVCDAHTRARTHTYTQAMNTCKIIIIKKENCEMESRKIDHIWEIFKCRQLRSVKKGLTITQ